MSPTVSPFRAAAPTAASPLACWQPCRHPAACGSAGMVPPTRTMSPPPGPTLQQRRNVSFATIPLPDTALEHYYNGFANGTLWPLFHSFLDSFHFDLESLRRLPSGQRPVLRRAAAPASARRCHLVHDYHLIPLAEELRGRDVRVPVGFFLHVPFPHFEVLRALPVYRELLGQLLAFDLLGFQTESDRSAFVEAVRAPASRNRSTPPGTISRGGRQVTTGVFPIGVDARQSSASHRKARARIRCAT